MAQGVVPVVTWMMAKLSYDFLIKGHKALGSVAMAIGVVTSAALIAWLNVHPGLVVGAVIVAVLFKSSPSEAKPKLKTEDNKG